MVVYSGMPMCAGYAIGRIKYLDDSGNTIKYKEAENVEAEVKRFNDARRKAKKVYRVLAENAMRQLGPQDAGIFSAQALILDDEEYISLVISNIEKNKATAEYAITKVGDYFLKIFLDIDDDIISGRGADVQDITQRLLTILTGEDNRPKNVSEDVILIANQLLPSDVMRFDKDHVGSFIVKSGNCDSHVGILARTLGIPSAICQDVADDLNGQLGIVDGYEGKLVVDPTDDILAIYHDKIKEKEDKRFELNGLKGVLSVTRTGKTIRVKANIGDIKDIVSALDNDAEGIGLFRSEFLYLNRKNAPSEDYQYGIYKQILEQMQGRPVTIRTLDIGADKQVDYFDFEAEANPALGYRGIRVCLDRVDIFKTQLRALFRASAHGHLSIMYPMITSLAEVEAIKEISAQVRRELLTSGIDIGNVREGIMIETPAAALISDELAKHVDFFSIGTNDLTQYTLAADRQSMLIGSVYNSKHPAVMKLIRQTIDNGHNAGIKVCICGEAAADTSLTAAFVQMGVDELSVNPSSVLAVREAIITGRA